MAEENTSTTTQGIETPATETIDLKEAIQADIKTIKTAIADLKEKGEDLFAEEIANLTQKLDNAQKELEDVETEIKTWFEKFREKHGVSVWVAVIGGGYIMWQVIAAIGRVLGVV